MPIQRLKAAYLLNAESFELVYAAGTRASIAALTDVAATPLTPARLRDVPHALRQVEALFSGWGMPLVDDAFLKAAPNLKIIFYAAGAVGSWATPAMFDRGVRVTSSIHANSVPVAEYTLSTILFSLKHGWRLTRQTQAQRRFVDRDTVPGNYGSVVGLISLGMIGRLVLKMLKPLDLEVIVYDPFLSHAEAKLLGVEKVSLTEVFERPDVVSVHTPLLPETQGMIDGALLRSMKRGATLINTARGKLINQPELIDVLRRRPDLQAVLDVCDPEPPAADCPLFDLPNVVLTPHIAGSAGRECQRLGHYMLDELERYLQDKPLRWEVTQEMTYGIADAQKSADAFPFEPQAAATA
ncbi:MAG TPA: hydroxyacid dehydrogenase [Tepidisphaeraceae bacterium]|jgi:phosphoglycerate dehydrogenase-like enzyme